MEPADGNLLHAGIGFRGSRVVMCTGGAAAAAIGAVPGYLAGGIALSARGAGVYQNTSMSCCTSLSSCGVPMFLSGWS